MERERNNTGLIVVVTLLVVAVLGLIGFIVYDKVIKDSNEPNTEENTGANQDVTNGSANDQIGNTQNNNKESNNKEENSSSNNNNNSTNVSKDVYELIDITDADRTAINKHPYLLDTEFKGAEYYFGDKIGTAIISLTGIEYEYNRNISLNNKVISANMIYSDLKIYKDLGYGIILAVESGEIYFCDIQCLQNGNSEQDMKLMLNDKSVKTIFSLTNDSNNKLFVNTANGIKEMIKKES